MSFPQQIRTADDLFFGSARVALMPVPGEAVRFVPEEWTVDMSPSALETTLARSGRIAVEPGLTEADVVVPCIPAREIVSIRGPSKDVSDWPEELRQPLLKVPIGTPGALELHAVASGARSCLVKVGKEWYRLKGSGNDDQGFVLRDIRGSPNMAPYRDIRGSAFLSTAVRENFMTAQIGKALEPLGIIGGNEAMGYYTYGPPNCPLEEANQEVVPACIVERTRGDRRLGSHLLAGIELLLPLLLDEAKMTRGFFRDRKGGSEFALSLLPKNRRDMMAEAGGGLISTAELAYYHAQLVQRGNEAVWVLPPECLRYLKDEDDTGEKTFPLDNSMLADLLSKSADLPEKAPPLNYEQYPQQWTTNGPQPMGDDWKPLWDETVVFLASALKNIREERDNGIGEKNKSVLAYLFSHLGKDCGRFLRHLHNLNISWGTYQDEMCRREYDEWHCNAHANNMVLLTEEEGMRTGSFLSYLDLDMAFDGDTFVDTSKNIGDHSQGQTRGEEEDIDGDRRRSAHEQLLRRENANFIEVLAGGDSSNGVPQVAKSYIEEQSIPGVKVAKAALYDTLILAYQDAYDGGDRDTGGDISFETELHAAAYAICKLAVIVMANFIA